MLAGWKLASSERRTHSRSPNVLKYIRPSVVKQSIFHPYVRKKIAFINYKNGQILIQNSQILMAPDRQAASEENWHPDLRP